MSSDSDHLSTANSVKCRRYRQRRRAGVVSRTVASSDEQRRLLSLPYETLNEQQKARVRYYRRQARIKQQHEQSFQSQPQSGIHVQQQAPLVSSRLANTSHTTTTSPPMGMTSWSHPPLAGIHPMSSQSSIPPFIPVAMIPSSCFTTMFPHVTTSSTIPVVFQSQPTTSLPVVFQQQPHYMA